MITDKKTIIIVISALVAGLILGWLIFGGSGNESDENRHDTEMEEETTWTCSMHPQIRQNEPGDCPICGMELIPVDEDENEMDPNAIRMSETAMQLAGVHTAAVGKTKPLKSVRLNGKVKADERLVHSQSTHIPGRIEKLMVNYTGEFVKKGQTIAYVYSPDLESAQEELLEAYKIKAEQPQMFNAAKEKLKNWKLTDNQIAKILESGKIREEFQILADVTGYVTKKNVKLGDYVKRGQMIYEITGLSKVWVLFDVYETDILWIKKGDQVNFTVASLPGKTFNSTISYIDPIINPMTRVAKARVEMNNSNHVLKPEMFASGTVEASLPDHDDAVTVPKTAVMWTGKRSVVYVKNTTGNEISFLMREVTLGPALGDGYIIEDGLQEGEEIAVYGTFSIDAAAQLAGKPSMMSPEGGQVMTGHDHGGTDMGGSASKEGPVEELKAEVSKSLPADNKVRDALQPLYKAYLQWKDALAGDNLEEARKNASGMKSALDKIDMGVFKGDSHQAWMDYQETLDKSMQHVQHFSDIEQLRKAFQTVSATMVEMTKLFNPLDETIYVQHCPMADNNKGADWLSTDKEIKNPYFGSSMLTCGEVTRTIK